MTTRRRKISPTVLKGVALGLVVSVVTLTPSAAHAGTGPGAAFNLGRTNAVNATTVLQGLTNGQQLRVANSSTGPTAGGIVIQTDPHRPPLTVNSHAEVAHLNLDLLDGFASSALQTRVTGQCAHGTSISAISSDGSTSCTSTAIIPIREDILSDQTAVDVFTPAGVTVSTDCHVGGQPAGFSFHAGANSGGTLNWMFSLGGTSSTVNANGAALSEGAVLPIAPTTTNRLEGQFIWAEAKFVITFTLHFLDLSGRCELTGTAEVGAL